MTEPVLAGIIALTLSILTNVAAFFIQRSRLRHELRTEFMAEQAIVELLSSQEWQLRSFEAIRKRIGGFEDEALRQLLVRSGALRFEGKEGTELWGLRRRNAERL